MEIKNLLEETVKKRLEEIAGDSITEEEKKQAFDEAMKAADRVIEIEKVEAEKDGKKTNWILKVAEMAAVPALLTCLEYVFKMRFTKTVCNFEKDYTFTTQAGRSISQFFRFKR